MLPKQSDGTLSQWQTLGCGAIAGTVGQTVAYPLDLVRRRLQVQTFLKDKLPPSQIYNGTWDAIVKIVKYEGVVGLYRGTWPNYLKVVSEIIRRKLMGKGAFDCGFFFGIRESEASYEYPDYEEVVVVVVCT